MKIHVSCRALIFKSYLLSGGPWWSLSNRHFSRGWDRLRFLCKFYVIINMDHGSPSTILIFVGCNQLHLSSKISLFPVSGCSFNQILNVFFKRELTKYSHCEKHGNFNHTQLVVDIQVTVYLSQGPQERVRTRYTCSNVIRIPDTRSKSCNSFQV